MVRQSIMSEGHGGTELPNRREKKQGLRTRELPPEVIPTVIFLQLGFIS
jgi:hypothetical protein